METFIDGGLFELLIAMVFAIFLNFIFLKRYLLILFSLITIAGPVLLFFIDKGESYYWLTSQCLFNSVFLVSLLWKEKKENPSRPLFNIENMRSKLSSIKNKVSAFFQNHFISGKR
jgi:hypothetical protein